MKLLGFTFALAAILSLYSPVWCADITCTNTGHECDATKQICGASNKCEGIPCTDNGHECEATKQKCVDDAGKKTCAAIPCTDNGHECDATKQKCVDNAATHSKTCAGIPCTDNGNECDATQQVCVDNAGTKTCAANPCDTNPCDNQGTCKPSVDNKTANCTCTAGFTGKTCDQATNPETTTPSKATSPETTTPSKGTRIPGAFELVITFVLAIFMMISM